MLKPLFMLFSTSLLLSAATYSIKEPADLGRVISEIEFGGDKEIKIVFKKGKYNFSSLKQKTYSIKKKCSSNEPCSIELIGATENADDTVLTSDYPLLMLDGFNNIKLSNMAFNDIKMHYQYGYRSGLSTERIPFYNIIGLGGKKVEFSNVNIKNNKLLIEAFKSNSVIAMPSDVLFVDSEDFVYKKGVISGNDILSGSVVNQDVYGASLHLEDITAKENKVGYGDNKYFNFSQHAIFHGVKTVDIYNSKFLNNTSYSRGTCFSESGLISSFNSIYDGNKVLAKKKNATRKNPIPPIGLFGIIGHALYDDGSKAEAEGALFQCGRLYLNGNKITNNYTEGYGIFSRSLTYYIGVNNLIANNAAKLGGVLTSSIIYAISVNETYKNNDGIGLPVLAQLESGLFLNTILDNGNTAMAYRYKNEGVFYYINSALDTNRLPESSSDYRIKNVAISEAQNTLNFPLNHDNVKQAIQKILKSNSSFSYGVYDKILAQVVNDTNALSNNATMPIGSQIK